MQEFSRFMKFHLESYHDEITKRQQLYVLQGPKGDLQSLLDAVIAAKWRPARSPRGNCDKLFFLCVLGPAARPIIDSCSKPAVLHKILEQWIESQKVNNCPVSCAFFHTFV